jgi:hypothetical protein
MSGASVFLLVLFCLDAILACAFAGAREYGAAAFFGTAAGGLFVIFAIRVREELPHGKP